MPSTGCCLSFSWEWKFQFSKWLELPFGSSKRLDLLCLTKLFSAYLMILREIHFFFSFGFQATLKLLIIERSKLPCLWSILTAHDSSYFPSGLCAFVSGYSDSLPISIFLCISPFQTHQPKYCILFLSPVSPCFLKKFLLSDFSSTRGLHQNLAEGPLSS